MKPVTAIAIAAPTTLLVMCTVAGATAQVTHNETAVLRTVLFAALLLVVSAAATGNVSTVAVTGATAGVVLYGLGKTWDNVQ